jgi:hypothetical protein
MSIYQPRPFHPEEVEAIEFFDKVRGNAWRRINVLRDCYFETICDAGKHWQQCEVTTKLLKETQDEIDSMVEFMVEKYADWASD